MFRTALLRSARVAARPAALPTRRFASSVAMRPTVASRAFAPRVVVGVRNYSAGGALQKEEVEGRIMSLLQGFDKVSFIFPSLFLALARSLSLSLCLLCISQSLASCSILRDMERERGRRQSLA